jgi:hypothetical protein
MVSIILMSPELSEILNAALKSERIKSSQLTLSRLNVKCTHDDYSPDLDAAIGGSLAGGAIGVAGGGAARGQDGSGSGTWRFGVFEL